MPASEPSELVELERLIDKLGNPLQVRELCRVEVEARSLPVYAISLGNPAPGAPAVGYFGGVHGLERIGASVVLAFLRSLAARLRWDPLLQQQLERMRMVFMPVVNPGGLWRGTRANPQGVDLMRNAPVEAQQRVPFLVGGQRLSARLPWYRGPHDAPMQAESQALCRLVEEELLSHRFSIAVDCHSGFGLCDRIWFPYASTRAPIPHLAEMHALSEILDQTHRHHTYLFEPQSCQYLAHGDLWDHLYQRALSDPGRVHLPLTLEMGSWLWVKKNPRQLLSLQGLFNPLLDHREARVLRRQVEWLDFVGRAACGHQGWCPVGEAREQHRQQALRRWYPWC
ncbi:Zinc carboxypeptidase [Pseudomonas sp. OF001]|uniref:M14 family zinc carboxypeptidase n=1 Tax=unclassified Pseudomonas TaxID=196821 RepID=UPI0010A62A09|nr:MULTISPECIES: M14 family zinc carboxypeptidase [unclassified Pseudomonas]THG76603.1 zinc carboxypeptidase [Pseudomonas sp. A-1]CAD5375747.1 Zinc carboxypeptidase [Pseudomonas sp. OF001]